VSVLSFIPFDHLRSGDSIRQETRDKRQETRDKRQETRDKRQETRGKRTHISMSPVVHKDVLFEAREGPLSHDGDQGKEESLCARDREEMRERERRGHEIVAGR